MKKEEPLSFEEDFEIPNSEEPPGELDEAQEENEVLEDPEEVEEEPDPIKALEERARVLQEDLENEKRNALLAEAEKENIRKRLTKEKNEFIQYANERLLKELVTIADNLDRALSAPNVTVDSLKQGVEMISKQFHRFLDKENVKAIEAVGKKFDPAFHDVMTQSESEEHDEGAVINELAKGYLLNGRVLRPAQVVIAKKPVKAKGSSDGETDCDDAAGDIESSEGAA